MRLKVGELFAGVSGMGMGFERAGFEVAWQVEIDKDAVSVLERHYPNVPRVRDVREAGAHNLAPVDVIAGGFPCQDLSVAGKRAGLVGARSGLFWEAIRIVREMREATNGRYPAVVVLENVPGLLSSGITTANPGGDFAVVLQGLSELGAAVAWRILDARFFSVPQRRRRVFIVADFAERDLGERRACEVLSLFEGSDRDSAACREAGEGAPGDAENGAGIACIKGAAIGRAPHAGDQRGEVLTDGSAYTLNCTEVHAVGVPFVSQAVAAFGGNRTSGPLDVATACNAHGGPHGRLDFESETFVVANSVQASAGHHGHSSPRGDGADNLIPVMAAGASGANGAGISAPGSPMFSLDTTGAQAVAFSVRHAERDPSSVTACLQAGTGETGNMLPAVLIGLDWQQHGGTVEDGMPCLSTTRTPAVSGRAGMAVRRLTPRECERLMGWPDSWTRYRADGSEIPDGPRYRMIGNGVVAPVTQWLGERLFRALETTP